MEIIKVMNNSLVFAKDGEDHEIIVMGKGIGFMRKPGEEIDEHKIEKIFTLKDEHTKKKYFRVMEDLPNEYIEIGNHIIQYATQLLKCKFNDNIFISLVDHLAFAVERFQKHINLQNRLLWEIRNFYPEEFKVGLYALEKIKSILHVELPEEEAGNIAFHIVNAQTECANMENTLLMMKMMKDILNIIKYDIGLEFDKDSLNYSRLITHLQFFLQRLIEGKEIHSSPHFLLEQIEKQYPDKIRCARRIKNYVENLLEKEVSEDELLYLSMHMIRVTSS